MKCYCGTEKTYEECCQKFINDEEMPSTSAELMRSRYSAYAAKEIDYLRESLDPQNRGDFDIRATSQWANEATFTQLEILKHEDNGNKGLVEFKAHFTIAGEDHVHHEISTFRKQAGQWYYKSGKILNPNPTDK